MQKTNLFSCEIDHHHITTVLSSASDIVYTSSAVNASNVVIVTMDYRFVLFIR